jgi:hypothetical protein
MPDELSDEDKQTDSSTQDSAPLSKKRESLFLKVFLLVLTLSVLGLAIVASVFIPIVSSAIVILSGLLGLLQLQSVANRVETVAGSVYKH